MDFRFLLPLVITLGGFYLLVRLRIFFLRHPILTLKRILISVKSRDSRRALALALAGTLGVGNIVGVAVGIMVGGAGSVFWMLVSSIFASVLKYSESAIASDAKSKNGMISVI